MHFVDSNGIKYRVLDRLDDDQAHTVIQRVRFAIYKARNVDDMDWEETAVAAIRALNELDVTEVDNASPN